MLLFSAVGVGRKWITVVSFFFPPSPPQRRYLPSIHGTCPSLPAFSRWSLQHLIYCSLFSSSGMLSDYLISSSEWLRSISFFCSFFSGLESIEDQTGTLARLSPNSVWFHFLSLSHVCLFLSWCLSSADVCPFTLCPSHLIAFSVFHVIAHSFHPPTSSPALPKHSPLFGWSFLGVSRVSLPGSFLLRGPTHGDRERIIHGHWQTMGLVARPGKASMVQ